VTASVKCSKYGAIKYYKLVQKCIVKTITGLKYSFNLMVSPYTWHYLLKLPITRNLFEVHTHTVSHIKPSILHYSGWLLNHNSDSKLINKTDEKMYRSIKKFVRFHDE